MSSMSFFRVSALSLLLGGCGLAQGGDAPAPAQEIDPEQECLPGSEARDCLGLSKEAVALPQGKTDRNILGEALQTCSTAPLTGWFRDGSCRTDASDRGVHVVCAEMTEDFLTYTKAQGNDLSTPSADYRFPGLKAGDRWCLCAARWEEARQAGVAPKVVVEATHSKATTIVSRDTLVAFQD